MREDASRRRRANAELTFAEKGKSTSTGLQAKEAWKKAEHSTGKLASRRKRAGSKEKRNSLFSTPRHKTCEKKPPPLYTLTKEGL